MSVLITDGNERSTLAVTRALGRAGVSVTVASSNLRSLAGSSRYCSERLCYPSPMQAPQDFQAWLVDTIANRKYEVLIAMTDVTTFLVAQIREALAPYVRLTLPSEHEILLAQDKGYMLALGKRLGVACPETYMLEDDERLEDVASKVSYPVVIKPRFSWTLRQGQWVPGKVEYAHSAEELIAKYEKSHAKIPRPLIQEKIDGEGKGVFLLLWNGELKAAFCHRRLREKPPWGGVSVYRDSIPLDQEMLKKSLTLLQAIGWQGPAMVEYKVDSRDGQAKLMEVNGRFWGSLQLGVDAGINFPLILYRLALGEDVPVQLDYKVGVKSRWLLGDLDQLLIQLTHSRRENGFSRATTSKLQAGLDFMKFWEKDLHYEVFRFEDPGPGWYEWKSYVRETTRRADSQTEKASAH